MNHQTNSKTNARCQKQQLNFYKILVWKIRLISQIWNDFRKILARDPNGPVLEKTHVAEFWKFPPFLWNWPWKLAGLFWQRNSLEKSIYRIRHISQILQDFGKMFSVGPNGLILHKTHVADFGIFASIFLQILPQNDLFSILAQIFIVVCRKKKCSSCSGEPFLIESIW